MYYRVAIRVDPSTPWQWKSTVLNSLNALLNWLRFYRIIRQDQLKIFSNSSLQALNDELLRENHGLDSTAVTATQFLRERGLSTTTTEQSIARPEALPSNQEMVAATVPLRHAYETNQQGTLSQSKGSALDTRRIELEYGAGGDHDIPYQFALPVEIAQVLAWSALLARRECGELCS